MCAKKDSTNKDPLASSLAPDRVYYATGAMLDADDFQSEQSYHRGRLARLAAYMHGSGTVAGLAVSVDAGTEAKLRTQPGLAIDRLGRMIELPRPYCIRLANWYADQRANNSDALYTSFRAGNTDLTTNHVVVDLFIKFVICQRGKQPAFATGNFDTLNGVAPHRLRDSSQLELVVRSETDLPLPDADFPDLSSLNASEKRAEIIRYKLEDAWQEGTLWKQDGSKLNPASEHTTSQDGTEVLLARLLIPATGQLAPRDTSGEIIRDQDGNIAGQPPQMDNSQSITVLNGIRSFAFSGAELDWLTKAFI